MSILRTIAVQSTAMPAPAGMPSATTRPPCFMLPTTWFNAAACPDISQPTPKPSAMPRSRRAASRSLRQRVDREIGAQRLRQRQPIVADVGDDQPLRAQPARDRQRHQPHRPDAGDEDVLAGNRKGEGRVDGVAERIEDRRVLQIQGRAVAPEVAGWHRDVLRERAVALNSQALRARAKMTLARGATAALAANQVPLRGHHRAHRHALAGVRAHVDDAAHELVADDRRWRDGLPRPRVPVADVQIRSADAGEQHLDDDFIERRVADPGPPPARGREPPWS